MKELITPQDQAATLASIIGIKSLILKREDLHPFKSHKGRSIPYMMDHYIGLGKYQFALSSSGNAAIAAALHTQALVKSGKNVQLEIFVGTFVNANKFTLLTSLAADNPQNIKINQVERPRQAVFEITTRGYQSLRQSTDPIALEGYASLADELNQITDLSAIFVGTSSGTTALALAELFKKIGKKIQIHIVQTSSCHPMSEDFPQNTPVMQDEEKSLADAIIDKTALRKLSVVRIVKSSGGYGWIVDNDTIEKAQKALKDNAGIDASPNGSLGISGLMVASKSGWNASGTVVSIICGQ